MLEQFDYTLDPTGRRTSVTQLSGRQVAYTYDANYRLTQEAVTGDPTDNGAVDYSYDPVGNRTDLSSTLAPIPSATYAYDANDRLLVDTYDNNGNTLASGGDTFAYDFEDHLTAFNGSQVVNVYDGDGNRVARSEAGGTTLYLIDDRNPTGFAQVVDEVAGGAVAATYTLGPQRASQTRWAGAVPATSYYAHDALGSVRLLTDSAGSVTDTYGCEAFGNGLSQTGTTTNPYRFAGEQLDSTMGLYNLRIRWYSPAAGRFATADKFEGPGRTIGLAMLPPGYPNAATDALRPHHLYVYVANDPLNRVDQSGFGGRILSTAPVFVSTGAPIIRSLSLGSCGLGIIFGLYGKYVEGTAFCGTIPSTGNWSAGWEKAENIVRDKDWNQYEIYAKGSHIRLTLNGVVTIDTHDEKTSSGVIGFQLHMGDPMEVRVRGIKIKPL